MFQILKKELKGYFDHPTAYILLVVFLVVNSFFYFRVALLQGTADLRPMFDVLPWLFLFIIPAITMRLIAEERRTGTIELTLAQPIKPWQVLVGKMLGSVVFVAIALAFTLIIPLTLQSAGAFDWGQIVAQYIASLLIVGSFASIGIFASALTRNQVVAFIAALGIGFFFSISGFEVITIGLTGIVQTIVGQLSLFSHYKNMTRGVIDIRDVLYFATFIFSFMSASYVLLIRPMVKKNSARYRTLKLSVLIFIGIAVVINLLGEFIPGRIDMTRGNIYTLSPATKTVLKNVDDIVTVKVFASENLPPQFATVERDTRDMLRDFSRHSGGNVHIEFVQIGENDVEKEQEAASLGIAPVQFNTLKKQEFTLQQGYFGLATIFAGEQESIPFIQDTSGLEYQLASFIRKLTVDDRKHIAFLTGHGEKESLRDLASFRAELEKQYEVTDFAIDESGQGERLSVENVDVLIIAGPTQAMTDYEQQRIRSFMLNGGEVFFMIDPVVVNMQFLQAAQNEHSFADFVAKFGVQVQDNIAFDIRANESVSFGGGSLTYILPYPFWITAQGSPHTSILGDIQTAIFPWASSLTLDSNILSQDQVEILFSTTPFGGVQTAPFSVSPDANMQVNQDMLGEYALAVAIDMSRTGGSEGEELQSSADGRFVVVGSSDILSEQFVRGQTGVANFIFGLNVVDWLAQDETLISIRSKNRQPASLVFESENGADVVRWINILGVPLIVIAYGVGRLYKRKRKIKK